MPSDMSQAAKFNVGHTTASVCPNEEKPDSQACVGANVSMRPVQRGRTVRRPITTTTMTNAVSVGGAVVEKGTTHIERGGVTLSAPGLRSLPRHARPMLNREIALLMLLFVTQTFSELGSFREGALSTELIAGTCPAFGFHPSWRFEDFYDFASASSNAGAASGDFLFTKKYATVLDPSEGITGSTVESATSDDFAEDREEDEEEEEEENKETHDDNEEEVKKKEKKENDDEVEESSKASKSTKSKRAERKKDKALLQASTTSTTTTTPALQSVTTNVNLARFGQDEAIWERVMDFLPWREVLRLRQVSRFHFFQSLPYVTVCRMPQTNAPAFFLPVREDFDALEASMEAALQPVIQNGNSTVKSHTVSGYGEATCKKASMQGNEGESEVSEKEDTQHPTATTVAQRMFFGQLRRSGTVPMVKWLVNYVVDGPTGCLVSVENHRDGNTGRGKGCAWPTLADVATVRRLLAAHHRLFYDTVMERLEGLWLVPAAREADLRREVAQRQGLRNHPRHMPRGTIVMELPATTTTTTTTTTTVPHVPVHTTNGNNGPRMQTTWQGSQTSYLNQPTAPLTATTTATQGENADTQGLSLSLPLPPPPPPPLPPHSAAHNRPQRFSGAASRTRRALPPYRGPDHMQPVQEQQQQQQWSNGWWWGSGNEVQDVNDYDNNYYCYYPQITEDGRQEMMGMYDGYDQTYMQGTEYMTMSPAAQEEGVKKISEDESVVVVAVPESSYGESNEGPYYYDVKNNNGEDNVPIVYVAPGVWRHNPYHSVISW